MNASKHPFRMPPRAVLLIGASLLSLGNAGVIRAETIVAEPPAAPTAVSTPPAPEFVTANGQIERPDGMVENRYFVTLMTQTFDGVRERSFAQKAGFARLRHSDESWIKLDYGDGAMTIGSPGKLQTGQFENTTPTEVALAYDYKTHRLRGNRAMTEFNNRFIVPLLDQSPPTGHDATWTTNLTPAQLGVTGAEGDAMAVMLSRHYFRYGGRDLVLLDYVVPAFSYRTSGGETVVHWAHGAALVDPGFGQVYWSSTLQRAAAEVDGAEARPYRYARTFYAMDAGGKPLLDLAAIPEMKPLLAEFGAANAKAAIPATTTGPTDQTPLELSAKLDIVAFAIAENSTNQLAETIGGLFTLGTGINISDFSKSVDLLLNYAVLPIPSAASGVQTAAELAPLAAKVERLAGPITKTLQNMNAMNNFIGNAREGLVTLQAQQQALEFRFVTAWSHASTVEDLVQLEKMSAELARMQKNSAAALEALKPVIIRRAELVVELAKLNEQLPQLTKLQSALAPFLEAAQPVLNSPVVAKAAQSINGLVGTVKGLSTGLTRLGYVANIAGIGVNIAKLKNFDPGAGDAVNGDRGLEGNLNGNYAGWKGVAEPFVNLLAIGGDSASGNAPAAILDVVNFVGGRAGDIYMTMKAMNNALDKADAAQRQEAIMKLRLALTQDRNAGRATIARIDATIAQINADLSTRPGGGFRGDKLGPDGRITIAYWLYLHDHDKQALRAYGIDPNGPIGVYPRNPPAAQIAQTGRPAPTPAGRTTPTPPTTQPRQPGGPNYPTAQNRPRPQTPPPGTTPSPTTTTAAATDPRTAPPFTPVIRPEQRPLQTSMDDPYITSNGTAPLDVSPLDFDPVTFEPVEFTPVTWDPVTFEPVTWEPPEWVPPHFDAPKPSEIPWTDFGDNPDLGSDIRNLAFDYGDMEGQVATDLSPYEEWLKKQDVRELERLARAAGYPNLASALADRANLLKHARDTGFREWAYSPPAFSGSIGIWASEAQHDLARAQLALGDLLDASRDIFSSGGFSDVGIKGFDLGYVLRDFGVEDGDIVDIELSQFGRNLFTGRLSLLNAGTRFSNVLRSGVAQLVITAVNEGALPPNTAEITIDNVTRGEATQSYSLKTGETATLRIEAHVGGN